MNLHEYQAKELFARYGLPVLPGQVAQTPEEARDVAAALGGTVVVKAQVLVGGRGKAGGVKLAHTPEEAFEKARDILALTIKGLPVRRVLVTQAADIARELYLSILLDRSRKLPLVMLSAEGGVDIEEVARTAPEKIVKWPVPLDGPRPYQARALFKPLLKDGKLVQQAADILLKLWRVWSDGDCQLAEINPLAITPEGKVLALDAKVSLDDNARFRHPEWDEFTGLEKLDPREREAAERGLQYVGLEGDVGLIANGAGLAMATCDIVHEVGGKPANFLDIGGGASAQVMASALEVINNDPSVKSIFINIFGGITKGEEVANGIVQALEQVDISSPIVIRLDGTNAEQGREILKAHESDRLVSKPTMLEAARTAVELAKVNS